MPSDFRNDREFSYDPPDDNAPLEEKLAYQRKLRKAYDDLAYQKPSAILDLPLGDDRWYTDPFGVPPHVNQERQKRQLKRYAQQ